MKYLQNKTVQRHEDEILEKLNQFKKKINSEEMKTDKESWMNNKLKFHIDSARAYSLNTNKERAQDIKDQIAAEGGQIIRKQADETEIVPKSIKMEDVISITDLINLT